MRPTQTGLDEIIRRVERLDEWTDFEDTICKLRAQLHRFIAPLQYLLVGMGPAQQYREGFFEGMVRAAWEALHQEHRQFLESFPDGYQYIGKTLDGASHPAVTWVKGIKDLASEVENAIVVAMCIPAMRDGCNKLQASVIYCLEQHSKTVKKEISELVYFTHQIRGSVPNTIPQPLSPSPAGAAS